MRLQFLKRLGKCPEKLPQLVSSGHIVSPSHLAGAEVLLTGRLGEPIIPRDGVLLTAEELEHLVESLASAISHLEASLLACSACQRPTLLLLPCASTSGNCTAVRMLFV